jgi:hypothetical protein
LPPDRARSWSHLSQYGLGVGSIGGIDEQGHTLGFRNQFTQQFEPLCRQLSRDEIDTCQVAGRPSKTGDKAEPDRVIADDEDNWDSRSSRLGRECRSRPFRGGDYGDLSANEVARQGRQPLILTFRPAVFDRYILALDIADLL